MTNQKKVKQKVKPNIVLIMSDDVGWGDLGCYCGGENRGAPTPHLDRMAQQGLQFLSFYAQASCTAGRAAVMTGRLPIRSGMTSVGFPGQGGGLPKEEITIAQLLNQAGYSTFMTGKWHLGEADYALPTAHGFDEMKNVTLYHLNAYTYNDPAFNPDFPAEYAKTYNVLGLLEGKKGEKAKEIEKIDSKKIPFLDELMEKSTIDYLKSHYQDEEPFFMYVNTTKMHQPNLPHPDFVGKSMVKSRYGDALVELDTRVGRILDTIRELGIAENTLVIWTTDNGAWQDVYPDCGYTPFRGTKGTDFEGGFRVPAIAWWPSKIPPNRKTAEIAGGLDLMATFGKIAGYSLPEKDNAGKPILFDSFDLTPLLFGTGQSTRNFWVYQTETELQPGAIRYGKWKALWNLRETWKGQTDYAAVVPNVFDLWQDPQEQYDIFMNSWAEKTWTLQAANRFRNQIVETYLKYPNRPLQGEGRVREEDEENRVLPAA